MDARENRLRAVRFESPEHIPINFGISAACWHHYPQDALRELMADHPLLFPDYEPSDEPVEPQYAPWRRADEPYTDSWGCVWETAEDGITGAVVDHALADWDDLEDYTPPSPEEHNGWGPIDWEATRKRIESARRDGRLARGGLRHGHTYLTLTYLRGYENLTFDMADGHPLLPKLIGMVEAFNMGLARRYLEAGVEWLNYPEDLGMQQGPMLSPAHFREYILPSYRRLMAPAKRAGCVVHVHSDGDIRTLVDDILDAGAESLNLQDLVNGIDWMAENLTGRVCIDLDIDRQRITRFGTPAEVDEHVRNAVAKLGSPEGGLSMSYDMYPGIPLENARALMDAMEKYSTWHS